MVANYIIKRPIITEKSLKDASYGIFTFEVDRSANKKQIRKAVEEMFSVHIEKITTVIIKGKKRFAGKKRNVFKTPDYKKARVKVRQGESIDLFEVGK